MVTSISTLVVPKGIRFTCSECANCCFEWPVPITKEDFKKIQSHTEEIDIDQQSLFRVLNTQDDKLAVFSHSLEKRADGKCEFLTEEKRCYLHEKYGAEAKPSMCRLFPYTFTGTPDGVFCSISFASSATIFNEGKLLESELEHLEKQYELFKELFPNLNLNWSDAQVIDGVPLTWDVYRELEAPILSLLEDDKPTGRIERNLFEKANSFRELVPSSVNLNNLAGFEARPKLIDQVLIKHLLNFYCPYDVFKSTDFDFEARSILEEVLSGENKVELVARNGQKVSIGKLFNTKLPELHPQQLDMLRRFLYLRIFSKLYFGPGFNFLSVISGAHHLIVMALLARIRLKLDYISGEITKEEVNSAEGLTRMAESFRTIERKLTTAIFSEETVAMLEVFLASPQRVERLISLAH